VGSTKELATLPRPSAGLLRPSTFALALLGSTAASGATAAFAASDTPAQVGVVQRIEVDLAREPPFDTLCLPPACSGASPLASLLAIPPLLVPTLDYGLVEERLHRAIAGALQDAASAAFGNAPIPEPVVDFARTAAAAALGDAAALERLGGLGASALRAALAFEMDRIVPAAPACAGVDRIDALYEGLALSASLWPLKFPLKKGRVPAGCVETAKRAARAVDVAVIDATVPVAMRSSLDPILGAISAVQASCGGVAGASERLVSRWKATEETLRATNIGAIAQSLRHLNGHAQATPMPATSADADASFAPSTPNGGPTVGVSRGDAGGATALDEAERACGQALAVIEAADPSSLEAWAQHGFASASLESLVQTLRLPALPCPAGGLCAQSERVLGLVVRLATGQATAGDLRAEVQDLARAALDAANINMPSTLLRNAVAALDEAVVVRGGVPTIDPDVVISALAAKYDVDASGSAALRALIGPTPWLFELNGGLPNVDFAQGKIVADVTLGYSAQRFRIVGRGAVDQYDMSNALLHRDYAHYSGSLEGSWSSNGPPDGVRVELRLSGSFDYYDTTSFPFPIELDRFFDFDSRIARGSGFVGVHYGGRGSRVALDANVGGGAQYEDPDTTTFPGAQLLFKSQTNFSAHASSQALVVWRVFPRVLGFRFRADGKYFDISRSELTVSGATPTLSSQQQTQLELQARLFVDIDAAALAGFVPAAWVGSDYLNESGGPRDTSLLVAVVGIGVTFRGR